MSHQLKNICLAAAVIAALVSFSSCKGEKKVEIVRLDKIVNDFGKMDPEARNLTLDDLQLPMGDYLYMMGLTSPDLAGSVDTLSRTKAFTYFYPDVAEEYSNIDDLQSALGKLNANIISSVPSIVPPSYYSVISPYNQQIMIVDSMIYIALNHYLGADYEAYEGMPGFVRRNKTRAHIPYDVAEALISVNYPYTLSEDDTLLNRMLYEGAVAYAASRIVDGFSEAEYMGWDESQFAEAERRKKDIWQGIVSKQLLYSTDPMDAERLFSPSPATTILGDGIPGRAGRYMGYEIVKSYMKENPNTTLKQLLSPHFYGDAHTLVKANFAV